MKEKSGFEQDLDVSRFRQFCILNNGTKEGENGDLTTYFVLLIVFPSTWAWDKGTETCHEQ